MIKVGDHLPEATLFEFFDVEANGCSVGPNAFKTADWSKVKKLQSLDFLAPSPPHAPPNTYRATSSILLI